MQRRATVLKVKLAQAQHAMTQAISARSNAAMEFSRGKIDDAAFEATIQAVKVQQGIVETIESAMETARREDREDDFAAKRASWIAARERAVELSAGREKAAKAVETAVKALATALQTLDEQNDAVLLAIYEATVNAEPVSPNDASTISARHALAPKAVHLALQQAFVLALKDAGIGETGVDLTGMIEFHNPNFLAHGNRDGMVAAVRKSTETISTALVELQKLLHIIPPDPVEENQNVVHTFRTDKTTGNSLHAIEDATTGELISVQACDPHRRPIFDADGKPVMYTPAHTQTPQQLVTVKDPATGELHEEMYTCDVTTVEWGVPPGTKLVNAWHSSAALVSVDPDPA